MTQTPRNNALSRQLFKISMLIVTFMLLSCALLLGTSIGARFAMAVTQVFSPIEIQWQGLEGSLYSGITLKSMHLNQHTMLQQVKITPLFTHRNIQVQAQRVQINTNITEAISTYTPPLPKTASDYLALENLEGRIDFKLSKIQIHMNYLQQRYQYHADIGPEQTTMQIKADTQASGVTVQLNYPTKDRFHLSATGQLILPTGQTWHIKKTAVTYANRMLNANLTWAAPKEHALMQLQTTSKDPETHALSFELNLPHTKMTGSGTFGQTSDLKLNLHNTHVALAHDLALQNAELHVHLQGPWSQPQLSSNLSIGHIKGDQWHADGLMINYRQDFTAKQHFGDIHATLTNLQLQPQVSFQNLSLTSKNEQGDTHITLLARQDQSQLKSQFVLGQTSQNFHVRVYALTINSYKLIDEKNPQSFDFEANHIRARANEKPGVVSVNGKISWHTGIDLSILIQQLDLKKIPTDSLKLLLPTLENLDGTVSGTWHFQHDAKNKVRCNSNFTITLNSAYAMNLISNLPLDTSVSITGGTVKGQSNEELTLEGQLDANQGTIDFKAHTTDKMTNFIIDLTSKNIKFGQDTDSHVRIDASGRYAFSNEQWHYKGSIKVLEASYRLGFYRPVTYLPVETVIKYPNKSNTTGYRYHVDIDLDLGEKTNVHVIGFHGQVKGKLHITSSDTTQTLASGEIMLDDATLLIYKQTLPVQRLTLSWFNNPIILPNLDMRILAKGLRDIDGRDQMQQYGLRAYGALDNLRFDYFSAPAPMNSFQVLIALLTDSSYTQKANYESLDRTLAYYNNDQKSSQLREIMDILDAVKSIPFFDNVDISEITVDENNPSVPDLNGITITKRLDRNFSLRYRLIPNSQGSNRISLDTNLSNRMILTNFIQNEGDVGIALNYFSSN